MEGFVSWTLLAGNFVGDVFPHISLTYSLYRWEPPELSTFREFDPNTDFLEFMDGQTPFFFPHYGCLLEMNVFLSKFSD